jgi:hypothetical protein
MTVNFINIIQAAFSYQSSLCTVYVLQFGFVIFWQKDFGAKAAHKMLVKLTPGQNDFTLTIYDMCNYSSTKIDSFFS